MGPIVAFTRRLAAVAVVGAVTAATLVATSTAAFAQTAPTAVTTSPDGLTRFSPKAMVTPCRPTTTL